MEPRRCVNITIIDDDVEEGLAPQEFTLQLLNPVGVVIVRNLVRVEILDDDGMISHGYCNVLSPPNA